MSDASTTRMVEMYFEESDAPMFLSGLFTSPPSAFHSSENVEIDVLRDEEQVAIPIQGIGAGGRENEGTVYTNKRFIPPVYDEILNISSYNLIKRQAGQDPFEDPNYAASATREAFIGMRKLERKIRRAVEVQASQILQTGVLTLTDQTGAAVYVLDFQPKATHIADVGTTWATTGATGNPLNDLESLGDVVRRDGKKPPDQLIFGSSALNRFMANVDVKARLDNRRIEIGRIAPESRGEGAKYQGDVWIGNYRYEMWSYDGFYVDPQTGEPTPYVNTNKVIMRASTGRLNLTFGSIPLIGEGDPRAMGFFPTMFASTGRGLMLTANAWISPDRKALKLSVGTRPLCIPVAIDTFACLNTVL